MALLPDTRLLRPAVIGGAVSFTVFLGVAVGVGTVGDRQALQLLESTLPTIRFLCSAAIGAGATVLALMLTLLGLSRDFDARVDPDYFQRINSITTMCVGVLAVGVGLLVLLCVPLGESEALSTWYSVIYYTIIVVASLIGGTLVAITLTLESAVRALVSAADPDAESSMIVEREPESAGAAG